MIIETNFSVGEKVWFMHENKAISKRILSLSAGVGVDFMKMEDDLGIEVDQDDEDSYDINSPLEMGVKYSLSFWINDGGEQISVWEQNAFKTKEELLNSL